jgi:hypothetical protein
MIDNQALSFLLNKKGVDLMAKHLKGQSAGTIRDESAC